MLASLQILVLLISQSLGADLLGTINGDGKASTLANLITKAGLDSALSSGDFTIFAPTDAAFARVPQDILNDVLSDTNKLKNLLMYHVVSGVTHSADIKDDMSVATLSGDNVRLNVYSHNNAVTANGKTISDPDHDADNGVIHYIDDVIMPPTKTIWETIVADPDFSTLVAMINASGIGNEFMADPLTLFAPTNAAFDLVPDSDVAKLQTTLDKLAYLLEYHLLPHTVYSKGIYHHEYEQSTDPVHDRVHIRQDASGVRVNNAKVTAADINCKNGVVHKIDHVLIPVRVGFWLRTGKVGRK